MKNPPALYIFLFLLMFSFLPAHAAEKERLVVLTQKEKRTLSVEIAHTPEQLSRGLMHRTHLPEDSGMLFIFPFITVQHMWMKNTHIPLDMLFIAHDGKILHIAKNTTPFSLKTISSKYPVKAALEINAGMSDLLGISAGDVVVHDIFSED